MSGDPKDFRVAADIIDAIAALDGAAASLGAAAAGCSRRDFHGLAKRLYAARKLLVEAAGITSELQDLVVEITSPSDTEETVKPLPDNMQLARPAGGRKVHIVYRNDATQDAALCGFMPSGRRGCWKGVLEGTEGVCDKCKKKKLESRDD